MRIRFSERNEIKEECPMTKEELEEKSKYLLMHLR